MDIGIIRDRLVMAALPHVVFDGWTPIALAEAARDEGLDPTMPARVFPAGSLDAVSHFVMMADRLMVEDALAANIDGKRVPDRVFTVIKLRLERWAPHREAVRRALALLAMPQNLGVTSRLSWGTVDAIWRTSGDKSHDFSWYTRRATLVAVYTATVLYWLDDGSDDSADTWAFLKRRLADVGAVTKARKRLGSLLEQADLGGASKGRRFGLTR